MRRMRRNPKEHESKGDAPATRRPAWTRWDQPLAWGVPIGWLLGHPVRLHAIFLLYVAISLGRAATGLEGADAARLGLGLRLLEIGALLSVVVLYETARLVAVARYGGACGEVILWPLGNLAPQRPPAGWREAFLVAAAGPIVGLSIFAGLAPALWLATGNWSMTLPSPLGWPAFGDGALAQPRWVVIMFIVHRVNFIVLVANLLPMHPLAGARMFDAVAGARLGIEKAARWCIVLGLLVATALGIGGGLAGRSDLVALAFIGGLLTYTATDRSRWTSAVLAGTRDLPEADDWSSPSLEAEIDDDALFDPVPDDDAVVEVAEDPLDGVLAKIARSGMDSLTADEHSLLESETNRRRDPRQG